MKYPISGTAGDCSISISSNYLITQKSVVNFENHIYGSPYSNRTGCYDSFHSREFRIDITNVGKQSDFCQILLEIHRNALTK